MKWHTVLLAPMLLTTGCIGPQHYYGAYTISCSVADAEGRRSEFEAVAKKVADHLSRPLTQLASASLAPNSFGAIIAAPPSPSVLFSFYPPDHGWVMVVAPNPEEDAAVSSVRATIDAALKGSRCDNWHFNISHTSLAGG
jgi:hypothetical protein